MKLPDKRHWSPDEIAGRWRCLVGDLWDYENQGLLMIAFQTGSQVYYQREGVDINSKGWCLYDADWYDHQSDDNWDDRRPWTPEELDRTEWRRRITNAERKRFEAEHSQPGTEPDFEDANIGTPTPRKSTIHKERCRAIAALIWSKSPDVTIADMILRDEIAVFGCEGKIYSGGTLRNWINDLCPNRAPGRRPGNIGAH